MPLFRSRPQTNTIDGILEIISMGACDDKALDQLEGLVARMSDDDVKSLADALMTNLVKYPDNIAVLTGTIKALEVLPFLPQAKNEFIITLLLSLMKAPVNKKDSLDRKDLKVEVIRFLLYFVNQGDHYATLMMAELIGALDDTHAGISTNVFHALQKLAIEKPQYFERYSAALIKQLGSINKSTRAESAKLIGIIATSHPGYVTKAMPFLQSLASFYPDAQVKRNANEAYQIIWRHVKKEQDAEAARNPVSVDKNIADVVKLQPVSSRATEAQFTDDELKEIIELTRNEFKNDAGAILDSLGVGHLAVRATQKSKVPEPVFTNKPDAAPAAPRQTIATAIRREAKEPARPQPKLPLRAQPKEVSKPMQPRVTGPKCPKCGGSTWAAGQLCDGCAGAEFDRRAIRSGKT
jgi:hypothetical protein